MDVHLRLCGERRDVGVLREAAPHVSHGLCVRLVETLSILGLRQSVTRAERFDERLLDVARSRRALLRLAESFPGGFRVRFVDHRIVDVRAVHEGDSPPGHAQPGIAACRFTESFLRLLVVERERPVEALVESELCSRVLRRHDAPIRAQVERLPVPLRGLSGRLRERTRGGENERHDGKGLNPHASLQTRRILPADLTGGPRILR
ncbi:MAG: hypothetical protein ACXWLR_05180 [Myxococcales bacterium]